MPAWDEEVDSQLAAGRIPVEPSAPAELMWYLLGHCKPKKASNRVPNDPALAERARSFWSDGARNSDFTELLILAHHGGYLFNRDVEPFLTDFDQLARERTGELRLGSEDRETAAAIRVRLERLRTDKTVRQRYVDLLQTGWSRIESVWHGEGLPTVLERARVIRDRLARGTAIRELLPEQHIVYHHDRSDLLLLLDEGIGSGTLAISPIYFTVAGTHIVELPDLLHLGLPAVDIGARERVTHIGEQVARRLKVLSDPSRVALLAELARRPASITELAERFQLAQPTVSMHIKALREADLLKASKQGTRTTYTVDRERLRNQFQDVQASLLPRD